MTCRLLELKMHVNEILMEMMIDSLTVAEWGRLEEVKNLLESFAVNTDLLQTDALSLSYVDPFSLDLECHFSCSILINPWHELWWYAATFFVDPWYNITQLQSTTCFSMLPRSQCWFVITYTSHDATVGSHKPLCNRRGRWMMFYNVEINTTKISMYYIRNKSFLKIKVRIKFWFRLFVLQQREMKLNRLSPSNIRNSNPSSNGLISYRKVPPTFKRMWQHLQRLVTLVH